MRYSRSRIGAALIAAVVGFVMTGCEEIARKPEVPPRDEQPPVTVPDDNPIRLHDNVHVITEQQLGEIQMIDAESISFRTQVEYSPGDVIAVGMSDQTPYGLLRKVAAVSSDRLTVMTDAATIEDVIKQGTVRISGTLTPDDLTPENRAELVQDGILAHREGLRSAAEGNRSFDYPLSYTDGSVTVSGNLQLHIGYELEARYDDGIKDISFSITPSPSVTAEVTAMGSFTVTRQVGRTLKFAPIPIPSTPIYFTPELELYLGAAGNIKASVSARYAVSATVGAECEEACDQSDNWNSLSSVNQSQLDMVNFDIATEGQIEGQFSVFVEPKLTFNVFGVVGGPHVKARPYIRATATAKVGASDNACFLATLETGADGAFGAQLSVWGIISLTLDDLSFNILDPEVLWEDEVGECDPEPDSSTSIAFPTRVPDQSYVVGTAIEPLELPEATGGVAPVTYYLGPEENVPPGLQFDDETRTLTGTPTKAGTYRAVLLATDATGASAHFFFNISVELAPAGNYFVAGVVAYEDWTESEIRTELSTDCKQPSWSAAKRKFPPDLYDYSEEVVEYRDSIMNTCLSGVSAGGVCSSSPIRGVCSSGQCEGTCNVLAIATKHNVARAESVCHSFSGRQFAGSFNNYDWDKAMARAKEGMDRFCAGKGCKIVYEGCVID